MAGIAKQGQRIKKLDCMNPVFLEIMTCGKGQNYQERKRQKLPAYQQVNVEEDCGNAEKEIILRSI